MRISFLPPFDEAKNHRVTIKHQPGIQVMSSWMIVKDTAVRATGNVGDRLNNP